MAATDAVQSLRCRTPTFTSHAGGNCAQPIRTRHVALVVPATSSGCTIYSGKRRRLQGGRTAVGRCGTTPGQDQTPRGYNSVTPAKPVPESCWKPLRPDGVKLDYARDWRQVVQTRLSEPTGIMSGLSISDACISRIGPSTREWSICQQAHCPGAYYQKAASREDMITIINVASRRTYCPSQWSRTSATSVTETLRANSSQVSTPRRRQPRRKSWEPQRVMALSRKIIPSKFTLAREGPLLIVGAFSNLSVERGLDRMPQNQAPHPVRVADLGPAKVRRAIPPCQPDVLPRPPAGQHQPLDRASPIDRPTRLETRPQALKGPGP